MVSYVVIPHILYLNAGADLDRKQLYWVFDTVTTDSLRQSIDDFYATMDRLKVLPEIEGKEADALAYKERIEVDPESEPNLFANVFPIHPLPSHDPHKYAGAYFGNCVYCLEDYAAGEMWLRFFCDHMVHYDCGREAVSNLYICSFFPA